METSHDYGNETATFIDASVTIERPYLSAEVTILLEDLSHYIDYLI